MVLLANMIDPPARVGVSVFGCGQPLGFCGESVALDRVTEPAQRDPTRPRSNRSFAVAPGAGSDAVDAVHLHTPFVDRRRLERCLVNEKRVQPEH